MNVSAILARPMKRLVAGFALVAIASLSIGWTAGTVAASGGSRNAAPSTAPKGAVVPAAGGAEARTLQDGNTTTTSNAPTTAAIYPVTGYNSLGVAPAGTILAQGSAAVDMKADGSDKAAALKKATDLALSDARGQAAAAAVAVGVQLKSVYSVSISTTTNYAYPMTDCAIPPVNPAPDGGTSSSGSSGASPAGAPEVCIQSKTATPTSGQLVVTLIVAYTYA